ncbi:bifunctional serine/threonine-protein kinase/formylglycine-generating enzyme family protein [Tuwongella immobilis]|uniref:Protein kinase domain-containing protein n=1 Tax=Tuwongella immobilis TaxID=692036 RepID=A0A6C2YM65_9BACT|nr:bifunctional serine/threonine-protein kinase/formylglycine-generating enzyme family protein [Tuwongella immobilis]VIP02012.1 serine threonine protein kinase : Probable serine/threonine-protein kinase pknB OS=Planctomyces maris DSM 8797 GN=PM8797T_26140 PE=3 SV=1: Pkinase: FGE-sulfatase [Tuwongella immobilis]VTS00122.1 serine threonine protein kinase : Probable serine/threonine-protein kinase pknB OS=Planctomyces maris DSM 8797 GN=PM8797T_26140 PE=3 SV=1: Pkinase: FGE-sulfatase [Tuwongella immo
MWSTLQTLMRYSIPVVIKAIEALCPAARPAVEVIWDIREIHLRNLEQKEREQIRQMLNLSTARMDALDELFALLGSRCSDLLQRMEQLETQGHDSSDEIARAVLKSPELQGAFDSFGQRFAMLEGRVDQLDVDVQRLDAQYASLEAFAKEQQSLQIELQRKIDNILSFQQAKQLQAAGRFVESEPILRELADAQTGSTAVAVALAVAQHENPSAFDTQLKRAKRLRPQDAQLAALASAATLAVTGQNTPAQRSPSDRPSPLQRMPTVGDTLDGWRLDARIGGGGWGLVFRASRNDTPKALKVMRPELVRERAFVDAFTDEVWKLLRVNHANVVRVERNGFCTAFQCHYFVMPLIDGVNLEQHLSQSGKPTPDKAMTWLMGLLDGLEAAHAQGLIHRDIKPQNVMIRPDSTPVLIDFGIAGLIDVPGHTQAIGKSSFFAPPELHSIGQADVRSDLFMLAATIFYALRYDQPIADRVYYRYESSLIHPIFVPAFDAALSPNPSKRPADVAEMRRLLTSTREEIARQERERQSALQRDAEARSRAEAEARRQAIERQRQEEELERQRQEQFRREQQPIGPESGTTASIGKLRLIVGLSILGFIAFVMNPPFPSVIKESPTVDQSPIVNESPITTVKGPPDGSKVKDVWTNSVGMSFAFIPSGEFLMGSPNGVGFDRERPQHRVRISQPFWLGVTPVTFGQFAKFVSETGYRTESETSGGGYGTIGGSWLKDPSITWRSPGFAQTDGHPVTVVSWNDAKRYVQWLNTKEDGEYSLPTEAQWEYACRAGTTTQYFFGDDESRLGEYAWFDGNSGNQTHPVGEKAPNPWGLRDILGNVFEWCEDWYGPYAAGATTDPKGASSGAGRVYRGGSWYYSAGLCRSGCRYNFGPAVRNNGLGFRVAMQVRLDKSSKKE